MLDVYHWEPNGASGRILIALAEKRLAFTSHYVDVLAFEHFRAPLAALSESGEVPIVVLDGAPFTGESQVAELLEDTFPDPPLMPAEPLGRWKVRVWQKSVDDALSASVSELAWMAYGIHGIGEQAARARAAAEEIASFAARDAWKSALAGYSDERLGQARARVDAAVENVETTLGDSAWLAGSSFSLADVAVFPYLNYLPALMPERVSDAATPRTTAWLRAVAERPAVQEALGRGRAGDPFRLAVPGPEPVRWG